MFPVIITQVASSLPCELVQGVPYAGWDRLQPPINLMKISSYGKWMEKD